MPADRQSVTGIDRKHSPNSRAEIRPTSAFQVGQRIWGFGGSVQHDGRQIAGIREQQFVQNPEREKAHRNAHQQYAGANYRLGRKKRLIFANQQALKLLNLQGELIGHHAEDVSKHNDLMRSLVKDIIEPTTVSDSKSEPMKIYADGQESYFEKEIIPVSLAPTGEREARHLGDVILLKNITALKTLDLAKTNLLRTVSNELRAPVSSIIAALKNLGEHATGNAAFRRKAAVFGDAGRKRATAQNNGHAAKPLAGGIGQYRRHAS